MSSLVAKYNIILADPPWPYDNPQDHNPSRGGYRYHPMSLQDIMTLPVKKLAADDCALFLWATMPKLPEALEVIRAWGFVYVTCAFVWVKLTRNGAVLAAQDAGEKRRLVLAGGIYSGLGYWTNGNVELCLFAKCGRPRRVARNVKQVVFAPVTTHSAKPPEVRDRIVALMGDVPRIELFARERVPGWDAWGLEIDGEDIREKFARI